MTDENAKIGTLKELGVKPGDRVMDGSGFEACIVLHEGVRHILYPDWESPEGRPVVLETHNEFRLISRASDAPKTWGEMTDEEKRDISYDAMSGKTVEIEAYGTWVAWDRKTPLCETHQPIRIKPEPKRETVEYYWRKDHPTPVIYQHTAHTHRITFDLIDGEPDTASIKMERL